MTQIQRSSLLLLMAGFAAGSAVAGDLRSATGRLVVETDRTQAPPKAVLIDMARDVRVWEYPIGWANVEDACVAEDGPRAALFLTHRWEPAPTPAELHFVGPGGQKVRSYTTRQLFTRRELERAGPGGGLHWVSMHRWLRTEQRQLALVTRTGVFRLFDMATGERLDGDPGLLRAVRTEVAAWAQRTLESLSRDDRFLALALLEAVPDPGTLPLARRLLAAQDPEAQSIGASMVGKLKDRESLPRLREVFAAPTRPGQPADAVLRAQLAAGRALAEILGAGAAPMLEARYRAAPPGLREAWVRAAEPAGDLRTNPVLRLALRDANVRTLPIYWMIQASGARAVHGHQEWLRDPLPFVRRQAMTALAARPVRTDEPLLRVGLRDGDPEVARAALAGMLRLSPPGLGETLRGLRGYDVLGEWSQRELARRGDTDALAWLLKLATRPEAILESATWELLLDRRPSGLREAAKAAAAQPPGRDFRTFWYAKRTPSYVAATGVLAVLGDTEALAKLRGWAKERYSGWHPEPLTWLGLARDEASRTLLQEAADLDQDGVSDAALAALKRLGPAASPPPTSPVERFPEPPHQRDPWQPPRTSLPKELIEATTTLFQQGFADPRGDEYRAVKLIGEDLFGGPLEVTVHGWVFSTAAEGRFVACWNGLVYPAPVIGAAADLHRDVAVAIGRVQRMGVVRSRRGRLRARLRSTRFTSDATAASETAVARLKSCLLLRLGEGALARRMWSACDQVDGRGYGRPYPGLAEDWLWYHFARATSAHMRSDDTLALPAARELVRVRAAVVAELKRGGYTRRELIDREPERFVDFGTDPARLLEDQERRARERLMGYQPAMRTEGTPAARIAGLIRRLEDVAEPQLDSPGRPDLEESAVVKALVAEGRAAVEPLIGCIDADHRLTRSFESFRIGARHRVAVPVRRAALEAVARILGVTAFTVPEPADDAGWSNLAASLRSRRHPG